jgi:hypothetical protein
MTAPAPGESKRAANLARQREYLTERLSFAEEDVTIRKINLSRAERARDEIAEELAKVDRNIEIWGDAVKVAVKIVR